MTKQLIRHKRHSSVMRVKSMPEFKSSNFATPIETASANKPFPQIKKSKADFNTKKIVDLSQSKTIKKRLRHETDFSTFGVIDGRSTP